MKDKQPTPKNEEPEFFILPPPSSAVVDFGRKPVLFLPSGRVLVRKAGY